VTVEATEKRFSLQLRRLLSTRSGTLALAAGAAVLAGLVLLVFLGQYRDSVRGGTAPSTALVAGSLIPKGTAGDVVINQKLSKATTLPTDQVKDGAVADTEAIAGRVATRDIYPGQQITSADFVGKADPIRGKLTGDQRAVAVPLDGAHGLLDNIRTGDRVDVFAGFNSVNTKNGTSGPVLRTLVQNVLVLSVPAESSGSIAGGGSGKTSNITIRVTDRQAAAIAFAADNGKVWFALRPPAGSSEKPPIAINLSSLLAGSAPIDSSGGQ
jgi:Flp pilus assembly protein CpaB